MNRGRACLSTAVAERFRRADWGSDPRTGCPRATDGRNRDSADWPTALRPGSENDAYVDRFGTEAERADAGSATVCCYGAYRDNDIIVGRALVTVASAVGEGWLRDATFEHASAASFERAALELERCGAPLALVDATRASALDEARHAALSFELASRHLGTRVLTRGEEASAAAAAWRDVITPCCEVLLIAS